MNHSVTETGKIPNEDDCDRCGNGLGYSRDIHADDLRRQGNLTEGGGQLCPKCAGEVYPATPPSPARITDIYDFG